MNAIELHSVTRDYGAMRALDSVSLEVEGGQVFGFLGPNGAGKTTAIRILFDQIRPTSGNASVLGYDCQAQGVDARARMGYLPGNLVLYDNLTGRETIELFESMRPGQVQKPYLDELLKRLNLDPMRRAGALSKGNRQKLGLVLAMMHRPEVLVLDEPTSGLDPLIQDEVASLVAELAAEGHTIFFSSHILSEVERMCHRVAFIREGRMVAVEDIATLRKRSLHIVDVTFDEAVPNEAFELPGLRLLRHEGKRVQLEVHSGLDGAVKAIARYPVADLRVEQAALEDIFRAHYEGDKAAEPEPKRVPA